MANERKYREILVQLVSNDSDNQIAREKNKTAREALQNNQVVALEKITIESNQRIAEANKFVEDSEKKVTDTQTQETEKE